MLALVWPKLKLDINTAMSEKNIQRMTGDWAKQQSAVRVPGHKHQTGNQTLMHKAKSEMSFLRKRLGDDLQTSGLSLIGIGVEYWAAILLWNAALFGIPASKV